MKHMIFIMADQLRYDMLNKGLTPNIDSIAQDGITFNNMYCTSPLCVPSRGGIFTGVYPSKNRSVINPWHEVDSEHGLVTDEFETFYELLERSDYECLHGGKQHLKTKDSRLDKNENINWLCTEKTYRAFLEENEKKAPGGNKFRSFVPEMVSGEYTHVCKYSNANTGCYKEGCDYYFDGYFTNEIIKGLKKRKGDKPLFLSAMYLAPHPPLDIPELYFDMFQLEDVKMPENVGKWYSKQSPLQMYNLTGAVGTQYNLEQWREAFRTYMGLVKYLDDCVGRILDELKAQGIYDDSMIIFTSDHGEMLGSHRLFQKMCMYEESVRTPVYMKFPNNQYGIQSITESFSQIDLMPTICDYMGISPKHEMQGKSLLPMLDGKQIKEEPILIQFDGNGARGNFQRCIIENNYKLIVDIFKDELFYELYDITNDVFETTNLLFRDSSLHPMAYDMIKKLKQHMVETDDLLVLPQEIDIAKFVEIYEQVLVKDIL